MADPLFPDEIRIRAEPSLRKAVYGTARERHVTVSEFVRDILRRELRRMGVIVDGGSSLIVGHGDERAAPPRRAA